MRKVHYKLLYSGKPAIDPSPQEDNQSDQEGLDQLVSLLDEGGPLWEDDEPLAILPSRRSPNLKTRSTSMPQFCKNKWLGVFLDFVQEDLQKVNWMAIGSDNLMKDERKALTELQNDESVIIKPSDKGGNVVLLSAKLYEREVSRLLPDSSTYSKLDLNPFQALVALINDKLSWVLEADLITKKRVQLSESGGLQHSHVLHHPQDP